MTDLAANLTQVIAQSPHVTSIVAGEAATADQIKRMSQIEQSKRFEEQLRSTVVASEQSAKIGESEEEARRRLEAREKRLAVEEERQRRRQSRAAARTAERDKREAEKPSSGCAVSPFEATQVIDVCV
ncbi:hypothetical protein C4J81_09710 [Deltaproteobacteria bacterium Smac51]|nr:hypothetical protein C4J81_09710 [Deltaproteobacteria bacterium Smac51]